MLKIETRKVLEITEEDLKAAEMDESAGAILHGRNSELHSCGKLEQEADVIICNGRVLKNKTRAIFQRRPNARHEARREKGLT